MSVLTPVLAVFSGIGEWFATTLPQIVEMFYTPATSGGSGELTFLGVLAVASLGVSVIMLLLRIIGDFLHFSR